MIAGGIGFLANLLTLYLLHSGSDQPVSFEPRVAYIIGYATSFILQKFWVFKNYNLKQLTIQMLKFALICLLNSTVIHFSVPFLTNTIGIWVIFAQTLVTGLLGISDFLLYKFIVFRHKDVCSGETH
jgi:putative flippase GtrA